MKEPKILYRISLNNHKFKNGDEVYLLGFKKPFIVLGYEKMGLHVFHTVTKKDLWLCGNTIVLTENLIAGGLE